MSSEQQDLNKKVDELEAAAKKYASKDTVISIGGYSFTPAKLMVAFTIVSSMLGGLYGAFEMYKDYTSMKKRIAEYVAPDLTEFDKKLAIVEENSAKSVDYTRDIKNDLKQDIRRLETVVESVERSSKSIQRDLETENRATRKETETMLRSLDKKVDDSIKNIDKKVDDKIQKALDNPLNKL
jgi:uncharacterized membrane-anchored protein YjiN (DUF445 family)